MKQYLYKAGMMVGLACTILQGCNKWKDHTAITDPELNKNLLQQIEEVPELSRFADLLVKSGYGQLIAGSKNYTVFAPVNAALASLDPSIEADTARLRLFVGNHISNQLFKVTGNEPLRLLMINNKYNNLQGHTIEEASITVANRYGKNGYLNIIDKVVPALSNAWEFVNKDPQMPARQKAFLLSQKDSTGTNTYLATIADLRDEKKQYTFFVLADTAWDAELNNFKPFFVLESGNTDSTLDAAGRAVARDLVLDTVYRPAFIPDTVLSRYNTKLGIAKNDIAQTIKLSNGIVYIMRRLPVLPKHKFQPYVIQGEDYQFYRVDRRNVTYLRDKFNPVTGRDMRDVLVWDHNVAQFYLGYHLPNVPAMKYKAYWVALHDNINSNTGSFKQLLGIGTFNSSRLAYTTVNPNNFNEVYLGEFTLPYYNAMLNLYLTADNNTNDDANKITVDYIRLEPVL
ncbi:fasciclin domain-containing protein [Longitalea arenae]|uniref:fasciclin domain-containing protein n=1 Tax=Longitalea arenae TaxID=2812558 RepID=UPI001967FE08|nr:fasciclin domain-containing protein [Longitalea arenae]